MPSKLRTYLTALSILLTSAVALATYSHPVFAAVDNDPDCDTVAIIRCGAFSAGALREKASQGDVPRVYRAFGIQQSELNGFVDGVVWRDGRVTVGDKVVATGAMTAGRNYGGTPIPNTDNAGKYPTSKFVTEGQTAFVKMVNGRFSFAVIKSCGNPVSATPKEEQKQTPPPAPAETLKCVDLKAEQITRTKVRFTADVSKTGGASVQQYEFGFGDGMGITVPDSSYTYEYKKAGTYQTSVVLHATVNGETKKIASATCKRAVTIQPVVVTPTKCVYDSRLSENSPKCVKPVEKCEIIGKEDVDRSSADCRKEEAPQVLAAKEETPRIVAATGPEAIVGGLFGSGALGYGAYSYVQSRRHLIRKLLGR